MSTAPKQQPIPPEKLKILEKQVEFAFLILGIGNLLPFNAIISVFDFFMKFQPDYTPQITLPNINFALNCGGQLVLLCASGILSTKFMLYFSQVATMLSLALFPFVVVNYPQNISFPISCLLIVVNGLSTAFSSSSLFGMVSFFPLKCVIALGTGQSLSGLVINILRYIILIFLGDSENVLIQGSFIFFFVSSIIMAICIYYSYCLFNNIYVIRVLNSTKETKKDKLIEGELGQINSCDNEKQVNKSNEFSFIKLLWKLFDINFLTALGYITTFSCFPGASIKPQLFGLPIGFKINSFIFCFNLCDAIARKLIGYVKPTKTKFYLFTLCRLVLVPSFILVSYAEHYKLLPDNVLSILALVNVSLLASTSGALNNLAFALAPEQVEDEWKGQAGSSVSVCLVIGIFLGSFAGIIVDKLSTFPPVAN